MANWHFKNREWSDEVADPIQGEFFDEVADPEERRRGPAASLVREAIQNSLDAQAGSDPVRVRFFLSDKDGLPPERADAWLAALRRHLRAKRSGIRNVDAEPRGCRFVVVEDFGTRGLEGDPSRGQTPDEGERDDFFAFFRASGLSGKVGQEGGRWGVGKSVFNRASRINSFLALSVRRSDGCALLVGRCFLLTHKIDGTEYQPYGRYGVVEKDDFVCPVKDRARLEEFRRDFRLARELDTPGLSVVVPYVDEEITGDALVKAVLREYFYPILTGRLNVVVESPDLRDGRVRLDADTLLHSIEPEEETEIQGDLKALVQFAIAGHTLPDSQIIELRPPGEAPNWSDSLFSPTDRENLAARFALGELLKLRVPVTVRRVEGQEQNSYFDLYLGRDLTGRGYPPVFVRAGIIIPKVLERRVKGHDLHGIVVIEDDALSSMLGDAETPAHTHWSPDSRNFRDKYKHGRTTIDFVRSAPHQIAEILSRAQEERDWLALAGFFPDPDEEGGPGDDDGSGRRGKRTKRGPVRPPPPKPKPFRIDRVPGGFRVTRDNAECTTLPQRFEIRVAYDTSRGNPLTKYHPADFCLSDFRPRVDGAVLDMCEKNFLVVIPNGDEFSVDVTGFDENRDLLIKVRTHDAVGAEGGES